MDGKLANERLTCQSVWLHVNSSWFICNKPVWTWNERELKCKNMKNTSKYTLFFPPCCGPTEPNYRSESNLRWSNKFFIRRVLRTILHSCHLFCASSKWSGLGDDTSKGCILSLGEHIKSMYSNSKVIPN